MSSRTTVFKNPLLAQGTMAKDTDKSRLVSGLAASLSRGKNGRRNKSERDL